MLWVEVSFKTEVIFLQTFLGKFLNTKMDVFKIQILSRYKITKYVLPQNIFLNYNVEDVQ